MCRDFSHVPVLLKCSKGAVVDLIRTTQIARSYVGAFWVNSVLDERYWRMRRGSIESWAEVEFGADYLVSCMCSDFRAGSPGTSG